MLSTRLLPLLCLLSLSSPSLSQDRPTPTVPKTCSVTKPANQPFAPPPPYPAKPSGGQFWFGTDRLWTALPETGAWIGLGPYTPSDPTFRQKLAFVNLIWPLSIVSFGPTPTLVIRLVEKPAAVGAVGKVGIARVVRDFQGRWEGRKTCFWFSSLSTDRLFPQPGGRRVLFFAKSIDRHLAPADSKPASRSEHRRRCCPLRIEHVFKRKVFAGLLGTQVDLELGEIASQVI